MRETVVVEGVTLTRAALEKALEDINQPDIKHLDRVTRIYQGSRIDGVVIHGSAQQAYAKGANISACDWTVIGGDGYGYSFSSLEHLRSIWERVK